MLVGIAVLLGGASRENPVRLGLVELTALPLAAFAVRRMILGGAPRGAGFALVLLAGLCLIPIIQSLPLPPDLWTRLPGQAPRLEALDLAGLAPGWAPLSLTPGLTLSALAALLPPVAMFLTVLQLRLDDRRRLVAVWLVLGLAGLLLGMVQLAEPGGGPAYLYATTNLGSLVGFFANRNHQAGFLLATLPLAAAVARADGRRALGVRGGLAALYLAVAVVGIGVVSSRAGVILAVPTLAASLAILWTGGDRPWRAAAGFAAISLAAVGGVLLFALTPLLDRFVGQTTGEFRLEAWPYVLKAAQQNLPFGAGLGSFDRVFRAVEPLRLVAPAYFNHAHNDYLELWLETGWMGATLIVVFLVWLAAATWRAWRGSDALARGASIAVLVLLAHSLVDYPLRTETLACLFAFCCAALVREA